MADSRFSHSRSKRGSTTEGGLSRARGAREALRTRKGEVESAVRDVRSIPDDLKLNFQRDDYDRRERELFNRASMKLASEWGRLPLSERRDLESRLIDAMRDPGLIEERIGWLIDGSYGRGGYDAARDVIRNTRMNREAWLMQTVGEVEWQVPRNVVIRVWKKLSSREQAALDAAIKRAIRDGLATDD